MDYILAPWAAIQRLFNSPTYGETLEHYIVSKRPQNPADVERYTLEWQRYQSRETWL